MLVAFAAYFVIYDSPETATFLTPEERAFVAYRLKYDGQDAATETTGQRIPQNERQDWASVKAAFLDYQIWINILVYWGYVCPLYGVSLFLPTIINDLGYDRASSQLLTVPPYVVASILTIAVAYWADKKQIRSPFIMVCFFFQLIGFILCITGGGRFGQTYAGVFIAACAIYPTHPSNLAWLSNNLAGEYKRGVGIAVQISLGNMAGAMASNFYRKSKFCPLRLCLASRASRESAVCTGKLR